MVDVSISIVSHGQSKLTQQLLLDIDRYCSNTSIEVILTLNVPETLPFELSGWSFPLIVLDNATCKGFGENHNSAFLHSSGKYYCVLNPDIRLTNDPFPALLADLMHAKNGVVAPEILNPEGTREDNARDLPTPIEVIKKLFGGRSSVHQEDQSNRGEPDWLAGMFLLFPRHVYATIGGFDERYFLYYEDVDLCTRLKLAGYRIGLCHEASAIHIAQRSSHRKFNYFRHHLTSMMRFFLSKTYRQAARKKKS